MVRIGAAVELRASACLFHTTASAGAKTADFQGAPGKPKHGEFQAAALVMSSIPRL